MLERAVAPGGKMRQIMIGDAAIDGGPTVFTMRWVFDEIFANAGRRLEDHVTLDRLDIWPATPGAPSQRLDLFADVRRSADAIASLSEPKRAAGSSTSARNPGASMKHCANPS